MTSPLSRFPRSQRGFTLIELSIVLVIIGLLIGGILAAQSMISTAKINKLVRTFQQTEIAVTNFKTNYGGLPGDSNKMSPAGDNDGIVPATGEAVTFWKHLQDTGMLDFKLDYTQYGVIAVSEWPDVVIPSFGIENAGVFAYPSAGASSYHTPSCKLGITIGSYESNGAMWDYFRGTDAVSVGTAAALDNKLDDGIAGTGKFVGSGVSWGGCGSVGAAISGHVAQNYNPSLTMGCAVHYCMD